MDVATAIQGLPTLLNHASLAHVDPRLVTVFHSQYTSGRPDLPENTPKSEVELKLEKELTERSLKMFRPFNQILLTLTVTLQGVRLTRVLSPNRARVTRTTCVTLRSFIA
jgi:hypothetical protein